MFTEWSFHGALCGQCKVFRAPSTSVTWIYWTIISSVSIANARILHQARSVTLNLLNHHQFCFLYCQCKGVASSTPVTLNLSNDHHQFGFLIANAGGIICIKHVNKCHPSPVFYFADLLHHTRMNPNLHHNFARSFLPNVLIGFEKRAHQGGRR